MRSLYALRSSVEIAYPEKVDPRQFPRRAVPRPNLRIVPGRVSGEPLLAGSRITTLSAAALYKSLGDYEAVADLYPGFDTEAFRDAVELESSLAA